MGLDMYLSYNDEEIGYWRKHPNLHGYIVREFASGEDKCQPIKLNASDIKQIMDAVYKAELPTTSGFFFGTSSPGYDDHTIEVLKSARDLLEKNPGQFVIYQASW
jgi:hypothetical protein